MEGELFFSVHWKNIEPFAQLQKLKHRKVMMSSSSFMWIPLSTCLRSPWIGQEPTRVWSSTPIDTNRSHITQR